MLESQLIETKNLSKYFAIEKGFFKKESGAVRAVDDVSLKIDQGEILGLVGESGSGKTTLGKIILGLIIPDQGQVLFRNQGINSIRKANMLAATKQMQIIFQDPYSSLDPRMKIEDIILEGLYLRRVNRRIKDERLKQLLDMVGLAYKHKDRLPHQFSGGQRQRIAIARALAVEPEFLVLDEPVSNLDVSIQAQILNLFLELHDKLKLTYLFISHDLRVVYWISDRIAVMHQGKIIETALSEDFFERSQNPYTKRLIDSSNIND